MICVVLCPGTPEGSTGSSSGLKRLRRQGNGLKPHPTDWEKPGIEPATPGLQDIVLSPTLRRLITETKQKLLPHVKNIAYKVNIY